MAYLVSEWIIRSVMLIYVPQRRSAAASRTWLLLIFLLPWPGLASAVWTFRSLQAVFLADGFLKTGHPPASEEHFPDLTPMGESFAQGIPSGPGYGHENGQEFIVALLYAAQQRVVITTSYFVPDEPVLQAVRSATLRGVEVHLVVSKHANQLITQLAQRSFYEALLESGVEMRCTEWRPRHAAWQFGCHGGAAIGELIVRL